MERYHFFAYLARLKLIQRWPLMRNLKPETVAEHSVQVAHIAHALALIKNRLFGGNINPDRVAILALYHDASEAITGDLPNPIKYHNPNIAREYRKIEQLAETRLLSMLPKVLQGEFASLVCPHSAPTNTDTPHSDELNAIVKAADVLSAYTKCLEEISGGNQEFFAAGKRLSDQLSAHPLPEVAYFMTHFIPSFQLSLDEIESNERL